VRLLQRQPIAGACRCPTKVFAAILVIAWAIGAPAVILDLERYSADGNLKVREAVCLSHKFARQRFAPEKKLHCKAVLPVR